MAERDFFDQKARERTAQAVRSVESQTAAELVVQVRHSAGRYREADYLFGLLLAMVTLLVLLFAQRTFSLASFPVQTALAFGLGAFLSSRIPLIRRLFVGRRAMQFEAHRAARAAFVDLGISRCSGRWGILVVASMFERRVELVADIGVPIDQLQREWDLVQAELCRAVENADFERFTTALLSLGPTLAAALPHRDDDVNELPDEPADEAAGEAQS